MPQAKKDIQIKPIGEPDYHCLPLWVAQDILLKIQADQIKSLAAKAETEETSIVIQQSEAEKSWTDWPQPL